MDLRERIVDVGTELVREEGVGALGLREIARRAGVSHGAPRRYFPAYRDLLAAIARRGFADLGARLAAADAGSPRARLRAAAREYVRFALNQPGMFELMFRHDMLTGGEPRLRESSLPLFRHMVELVHADRPRRRDPARTTAALWSNIHGIAQLWAWGSLQLALGGDGEPDALIDAALAVHLSAA